MKLKFNLEKFIDLFLVSNIENTRIEIREDSVFPIGKYDHFLYINSINMAALEIGLKEYVFNT